MSARGFGPGSQGNDPWHNPWGVPPGNEPPPPHDRWRVFRDPDRGWIAGVCAGIAENAGVDPMVIRLAAIISTIFFVVPALVAYVALAIVLPVRPSSLFASAEQEGFVKGVRSRPQSMLERTAEQFRDLERRLAQMERAVTSNDFDLHRGFRDLGS